MNTEDEITQNGIAATLMFEVLDSAPTGDYVISLSYTEGDIVDGDLAIVPVSITNGILSITEGCHHDNITRITMIDPDCENEGEWEDVCLDCGETVNRGSIDALGHSYDDGVVTTNPTCTKVGVKTFTCSKCGDTYTQDVAATGQHNYEAQIVPATPTSQGYTKHTCTMCGDTYNDNYVDYVPSTTPETSSGRSDSFRAVEVLFCPGARRAISARMNSLSSFSPAGTPVSTTPMAGPWDSPNISYFTYDSSSCPPSLL